MANRASESYCSHRRHGHSENMASLKRHCYCLYQMLLLFFRSSEEKLRPICLPPAMPARALQFWRRFLAFHAEHLVLLHWPGTPNPAEVSGCPQGRSGAGCWLATGDKRHAALHTVRDLLSVKDEVLQQVDVHTCISVFWNRLELACLTKHKESIIQTVNLWNKVQISEVNQTAQYLYLSTAETP